MDDSAEAPTFKSFASEIMSGNREPAAAILETLLGVDQAEALKAADHFSGQMTDPAFMMKAMGMRQAVAGGDTAQLTGLLRDCFGVDGELAATAATKIRATFG